MLPIRIALKRVHCYKVALVKCCLQAHVNKQNIWLNARTLRLSLPKHFYTTEYNVESSTMAVIAGGHSSFWILFILSLELSPSIVCNAILEVYEKGKTMKI